MHEKVMQRVGWVENPTNPQAVWSIGFINPSYAVLECSFVQLFLAFHYTASHTCRSRLTRWFIVPSFILYPFFFDFTIYKQAARRSDAVERLLFCKAVFLGWVLLLNEKTRACRWCIHTACRLCLAGIGKRKKAVWKLGKVSNRSDGLLCLSHIGRRFSVGFARRWASLRAAYGGWRWCGRCWWGVRR